MVRRIHTNKRLGAVNYSITTTIRISNGKKGLLDNKMVADCGHFHITYVGLHGKDRVVFPTVLFPRRNGKDFRQAGEVQAVSGLHLDSRISVTRRGT